METLWNTLEDINISDIPIGKIVSIVIILVLTQVFRRVFVRVIVKGIQRLTRRTKSTLDDEFIDIITSCISWLIRIAGLWLVNQILAKDLGPEVSETIDTVLNIAVIFIIAYVIYRGSFLFGQLLSNVLLRTETELDDLLRPLMPKVFQAAAIIILAIKVSEVFLGQSAAALVGLLGGAGITLGLLLKDIVYDWFCTLIIYSDNIYREGDWVSVSGVNGFVEILNIGFRSTTLHITNWGSIMKMPNSQMISGIVENWSQNPGKELKWGINLTLKIDGISAQQTNIICDAIQEFPKFIPGVTPSFMVRFSGIENNARVIQITAFVNDANLYNDAEKGLNLAILELLEKEGIDTLSVSVEVEGSLKEYRQSRQKAGGKEVITDPENEV